MTLQDHDKMENGLILAPRRLGTDPVLPLFDVLQYSSLLNLKDLVLT